jgi:hypothetical protein
MVLPYLNCYSLYILGVFHCECFGILYVQGFFSEVLWWIISYIIGFLLQVVSDLFLWHEVGEHFYVC